MKSRVRASLIHLLISLILVSSVFAFVLLLCYPGPYSEAMGVGRLLVVLAGVDICLGPLITLIIFNPADRWLKFELAFIGALQLSALAYGATTVFNARPVYLVFDKEEYFSLVVANQIPEIELKDMHLTAFSMIGPKLVGARPPTIKEEEFKFLKRAVKEQVDLPRMPRYYVPYETMVDDVKASMGDPRNLLLKRTPEREAEIKSL
jgi:hypothetical protein